jgi:hypothetical protein
MPSRFRLPFPSLRRPELDEGAKGMVGLFPPRCTTHMGRLVPTHPGRQQRRFAYPNVCPDLPRWVLSGALISSILNRIGVEFVLFKWFPIGTYHFHAKLELPWLGAGSPLGNPGLGPRGVYKLFRCGKCIRRTKFL